MSNLPFVSIILPTYQREKVLCDTILQLLQQDYPSYELIVVDQTPLHQIETEHFLEEHKNLFVYLKKDTPGLPAARNFGLKYARGEIILFVDDDIIVSPNWVEMHVRHYGDKCIGGVTGRVLEEGLPVIHTTNVQRVTKWGRIIGNRTSSLTTNVEWASGANCSFRKELILSVNGFDELFLGNAIFEDTDFSFRVRRLGVKIIYDPEAEIFHLAEKRGGCNTRTQDRVNYYYWFLRNKARFFKKNFAVFYLPLLIILNFARALKVGLLENRNVEDWILLMKATSDGLKSA